MSDISQIKLGSTYYEIKDKEAREKMIDKTKDTEVKGVMNFVNGVKVKGKSVISQATAEVITVAADEAPSVDLTIDESGVAHFVFKLPQMKPNKESSFSASFEDRGVIFKSENGTELGENT